MNENHFHHTDHCVGRLRLILQGINEKHESNEQEQPYLVYAQRFDTERSDRKQDPRTGLFRLRRAESANGRLVGAVVDAARIRAGVSVIPFFSSEIEPRYTYKNSMEASVYFNLNKYADKEDFMLLHQ